MDIYANVLSSTIVIYPYTYLLLRLLLALHMDKCCAIYYGHSYITSSTFVYKLDCVQLQSLPITSLTNLFIFTLQAAKRLGQLVHNRWTSLLSFDTRSLDSQNNRHIILTPHCTNISHTWVSNPDWVQLSYRENWVWRGPALPIKFPVLQSH